MCGICGIFDLNGQPVERASVERMSAAIRHRGPDGSGEYVCGPIGLGHRRLSIIDLEGGAQPMANEDGRLKVVFNGEIYNFVELRDELKRKGHLFKTNSDTEVILHGYEEWGLSFVSKLNGMFAFALWDSKQNQLLLARDHLGIKPLYYSIIEQRILFGSEIKAILTDSACVREVDLISLSQLFSLRYVPSPRTLFHGIQKLPPAHLLVANSEGIQIRRFWNRTPSIGANIDEQEAIETYQQLLESAIRMQMRSDVPLGLFLSSGIDSGALLALMSQNGRSPVHTFTIGFEYGESSNETDEAREMARLFGADHSELIIGPKDYENYYERYLWDLEEPVGNETAASFYFVSLITSKKVKVALTGQGADEPWAGYPRHIGADLSRIYSNLPSVFTDGMLGPAIKLFAKNEKLRRAVFSLSEPDVLTRFVKIYSFFTSEMKSQLFLPWLAQEVSTDGKEARQALESLYDDVADFDPLTQMTYIDTRANLPDDLLMVSDKMAMATSLEARVPYLDYRIIEFVETLPPRMKLRGLQGKQLHKKALRKWLPEDIVYKKKKGFANPIDHWLGLQMRTFVSDCLLSENAAVTRYFDRSYIRELIADHEAGRQNHLRHIYLLISFELWYQQFISN